MSIIKLNDISKKFGPRVILSHANLTINKGELVGIVGRSGSGKTTLLNIIGLLDKPNGGSYLFNEHTINYTNERVCASLRRDKIGMITQHYALIKDWSVQDNIALPLLAKRMDRRDINKQVKIIAEKLNIKDLLLKFPNQISGGEAQRVAIARALIKEPSIILAAEPTGALDIASEADVLDIFKKLNKMGKTILIVTHNRAVSDICNTIYTIEEGAITVEN